MKNNLTPDESKVIESLNNPEWDYRTIPGIAKETKLAEANVLKVVTARKDLIRESIVPSRKGEKLYTLSKNVNTLRDYWKAFKMINKEKF
jgi:hypothetical protein